MMQQHITPWGQSVFVQRKQGLKRLSIRFLKNQKVFKVSAPARYPVKEIQQFIDGAKSWFTKVIQKNVLIKKTLEPGQTIQLLGNNVTIEFVEDCKVKVILKNDVLKVHGIRSKFKQQVMKYLRELAFQKLSEYSNLYAKKLGVNIAKITVKEMSSRYGSCTSIGNLNYCWRIVLAPEPVLAYLCAHEVSHLKEMNHSKAFWKHVASLCPDYLSLRKWLKQNGKELYTID